MKNKNEKIAFITILVVFLFGSVTVFLHEAIPQDNSYHLFSDTRSLFNTPNFYNVASNLPFLIVGVMGIQWLFRSGINKLPTELRQALFIFFLGVFLVGVGSGYYHLWPDNQTLVWDRLPMAVAFMALMSVIIGDFISIRSIKFVLPALLVFGIFSVVFWYITEMKGAGDLRFYILVQFLPILIIPIILIGFKPEYTSSAGYWRLLGAYGLAKGFEHLDSSLYNFVGFLSGHTLKHLTAALGIYFLLSAFKVKNTSAVGSKEYHNIPKDKIVVENFGEQKKRHN